MKTLKHVPLDQDSDKMKHTATIPDKESALSQLVAELADMTESAHNIKTRQVALANRLFGEAAETDVLLKTKEYRSGMFGLVDERIGILRQMLHEIASNSERLEEIA